MTVIAAPWLLIEANVGPLVNHVPFAGPRPQIIWAISLRQSLATGPNHAASGLRLQAGSDAAIAAECCDWAPLQICPNASLSSSAAQTSQTINFGNVLRGATAPSQTFTIYNLAANTNANYTANLKLTSVTPPTGDSALTTNLSAFNGLTAASGSNGITFSASLSTGNYTTSGTCTINMFASQVADDSTLPGAGPNNNGGRTVALLGNVGNATADASNSPSTFGPALSASVAGSGSYASLESTVKSTTSSGGGGMVGSTATILAGTNSSSGSAQTVSMAWRTQTTSEGIGLVSDVLDLSGMALSGVSGQTSPFVLQMDYDSDPMAGNEAVMAADQQIFLMSLDPVTNHWENAVLGNFGRSNDTFAGAGAWNGDMTLGNWGVNTANHTVWAVLDHNSDFAVVPEPASLVLLAAGVGCLVGAGFAQSRTMVRSQTD